MIKLEGEEVMLNFSKEKILTITKEEEEESYEIEQTATGTMNNVRYFRVEVEDKYYFVIFDDQDNQDKAKFVKQTNIAEYRKTFNITLESTPFIIKTSFTYNLLSSNFIFTTSKIRAVVNINRQHSFLKDSS